MANWVLTDDDSSLNLDVSFSLFAIQISSLWYIDAYMTSDRSFRQGRLKGSWATKAEAVGVINRLVHSVDPSTI